MDYSALKAGDLISDRRCHLDADTVRSYVRAVDDRSPLASSGEVVPPMALAALSVRGVVQDLGIPGGTLHLGQEVEFTDTVVVGETISCTAEMAQNSVRGGQRVLVIRLIVEAGDDRVVMKGKSTIAVPA